MCRLVILRGLATLSSVPAKSPSPQRIERPPAASPPTAPPPGIAAFVADQLSRLGDAKKAAGMAAYMKTTQPFFGVQKPEREPVFREMCVRYAPRDGRDYRSGVLALWAAGTGGEASAPDSPHHAAPAPPRRDSAMIPPLYTGPRELLYAACTFAETFHEHIIPAHLPLFKRMIVDGGWWDLVDTVAGRMISPMMRTHRTATTPVMRKWIDDENLWVRRTAIICQLNHNAETDSDLLFELSLKRAHETDFFIRKAIGWALRDYAWAEPDAVRAFLKKHKAKLSPLSIREAGKNIGVKP